MLTDKVVLVTGGAGLLGEQFAKSIIQQNGIAVIADINYDRTVAVKKQLSDKLHTKHIDNVELDITSSKSITNCIKELSGKYNKVDALVNSAYPKNANYSYELLNVKYQDFCQNINNHLGGYFLTCQKFIEFFLQQGHGNIINIASIYGVVAPKFDIYEGQNMTLPVEYAVIKSALIHLTKYLAKYCKSKNIRINCISPGGIFDNQPEKFINNYHSHCLNKGMLDKSDINGSLIYLLSGLSQCVNGQNIIVDDGFTL